MKQILSAAFIALLLITTATGQTPVKVDGTGGAKTAGQTRPPDNRRPRGTAVGLLGWRAGIRSDAFGAIPFLDAAVRIDAAGVAFIEAVSTNLDYKISADEIANIKARLTDLGLRVAAYRIDAIPSDAASRNTLLAFAKAMEIDLVLTNKPVALTGIKVAVEDASGMYKEGATTHGANLRDAAKAAPLLLGLSKQQPPEAPEWPNKCTDCATSRPSTRALFFTIVPGAAENYDRAVRVAQGYRVNAISKMLPISTTDRIPADEKAKIDAAVPRQALVKPRQARKLLIIDVCPAGGFYHNTVAHGNLMLQLLAKYTGAYEPIFDNNLENLRYPHIRQYDAVFLNSVVGPVFSDPEVLDGLIRYVREGGGVAGLHGTTFASQDLREFGELMGAQEGPHQYNGEPGTLKIDDPASPITKHFGGKGFSMMDEFYHFPMTSPYSREKLRVLLSVDAEKSDIKKWQYLRTDNDFGMVWIKREGKGRVFNSVLGHRPDFYMMPDLVKMMLGGIQFVLGDLDADTTPSAKMAQAAPSRPAFEVASVRSNTSGSGSLKIGTQPGGRFEAINMPLVQLIQNAYQVRDFQIIGGPAWMSDRFDVIAKAETEFPPTAPGAIGALPLMLQSLLAERFQLVAHKETREMDIYALVRAREDGRLGPRLRQSDTDCEALLRPGATLPPAAAPAPGMRPIRPCLMRAGGGNVVAGASKLDMLIGNLSGETRRIVENRTGLTGVFDIDLSWAPDGSTDTTRPSLFTALQEQLGLKLESTRAPVDVLVIDSISRLTPD